ncbi:calmodulin [Hexamita inflata]|uniref:Calmodulin n=1 Tax=Hexamita inflata TaxID=28002 RepID=A0AA86RD39_9EUKA|nr:calmodulin [Hexamita inflata]
MDFAEQMFKKYDQDKSGSLQMQEVYECLQSLGTKFSQKDIQIIVQAFDDNKNGVLDYNEFEQLVYILQNINNISIESVLFYKADSDKNGVIDVNEFMNIMKSLQVQMTDEKLKNFAIQMGAATDGIGFENFTNLITKMKVLM